MSVQTDIIKQNIAFLTKELEKAKLLGDKTKITVLTNQLADAKSRFNRVYYEDMHKQITTQINSIYSYPKKR